MLAELAGSDTVSNVLIYVSDSLRFDELPQSVKERSLWGKTVSASTYTGSGFPSILTGQYPTTHRVWSLGHRLPDEPPLLSMYDDAGMDVTNMWSIDDEPARKPPMRMAYQTDYVLLDDVEPPFSLVVHDSGGHMMYGSSERDEWATGKAFFADLRGRPERIRALYREGVAESTDRFLGMLDELDRRDVLDDTLVVFTSDHGEFLGEYDGLYDHQTPVAPELAYVPMAFAGAGLPTGERLETLSATVDVVPTLFSAADVTNTAPVDGIDLWAGRPEDLEDRAIRCEVWKDPSYPMIEYKASSVWGPEGGVVRHRNGVLPRLLHLLATKYYFHDYATSVRRPTRQVRSLFRSYLKREVEYGTPPKGGREHLSVEFQWNRVPDDGTTAEPTREQLRALGYLK